MGLTTAMYTGLSGMSVNQTRISTIGHNIANVNTTAFKGSRTLFQTQLSHVLSAGNGPTPNSGGVNPTQIGLGATIGATQKNFNGGSIETTGITSDLAIDGNGFFILRQPDDRQVYTRDGSFALDSQNCLVSADGYAVRGFGVDENFTVQATVLTDLIIPVGTLSIAEATENVLMDGDLSATGTIATQGSTHTSQALVNGGGGVATATTALGDLRSAAAPRTPLFASGNTITVSSVDRGDRQIADQTFVVGTDGTTLGDFAAWLEAALGIQDLDGVPGDPGVVVASGALVINSNAGEQSGLTISASDITSDNATTAVPFTFTQTAEANGSSLVTSFTVYDSLGTPVIISATLVMEERSDTGVAWRFYLEAPESTDADRLLGTGVVSFDTEGNFRSVTGNQVSVDRLGANSPLTFLLDFTGVHGLSTRTSSVIMSEQDGCPPGTLSSYSVGPDGTINGAFSNGVTRTLGQVGLAVMPNPEGLLAENDNLYVLGPNAGAATVTAPGEFGAGTVLGGALELSNVDLASEFIGLITSSTGFQAASRVISTSSDMLDQLLLIVR
ncbi:MAG: flagellar hook-basal body complex protein [Planctomycetes bacterium]|nr:flagellar hook-basal body complex protein [Planctomycetota bacterium]